MTIRLMSYVRLLIEPMFAYNHFDDADDIDVEEYDSEDGGDSQSSEDDKKNMKKKKVVIKTKGYQIQLKLENYEIDPLSIP